MLLLEARTCGWAASGRNGGFCAASLTHGLANGLARFPDEMAALERLGRENLDAIEKTVRDEGIDCDFQRVGELDVATAPHQVEWVRADVEQAREFGHDAEFLDTRRGAGRGRLADLPGGRLAPQPGGAGRPGPAGVGAAGRRACAAGCASPRTRVSPRVGRDGPGLRLRTARGDVRAARAALATNAFPGVLRRTRPYVVPVYDYALMTEPLTAAQLASVGWRNRQGIGDVANQFHYYRLTRDNRILWGGYDAIYHWRNGLRDELDQRPETFAVLAEQFFETFPQLAGIRFTHRWGGAIDTSTRFFAFQRSALGGRAAYSVGYTGLGVGADPVRRAADARPGRRPARPRRAGCARCARRPLAVPARAGAVGRHPAHPPGPGEGRRSGRAGAGRGCARSTGSGWVSTPDLTRPRSGTSVGVS